MYKLLYNNQTIVNGDIFVYNEKYHYKIIETYFSDVIRALNIWKNCDSNRKLIIINNDDDPVQINSFIQIKLRSYSVLPSQTPYYSKLLPYDPEYYYFQRKVIENDFSLKYYRSGIKIKGHYYFVRFRHVKIGIYIFLYKLFELNCIAQILPYEILEEKFGFKVNCPITVLSKVLLPCLTLHKGKIFLLKNQERIELGALTDKDREDFFISFKEKINNENKMAGVPLNITPFIMDFETNGALQSLKEAKIKKFQENNRKVSPGTKKVKGVNNGLSSPLSVISEENTEDEENESLSDSDSEDGEYIELKRISTHKNIALLPRQVSKAVLYKTTNRTLDSLKEEINEQRKMSLLISKRSLHKGTYSNIDSMNRESSFKTIENLYPKAADEYYSYYQKSILYITIQKIKNYKIKYQKKIKLLLIYIKQQQIIIIMKNIICH